MIHDRRPGGGSFGGAPRLDAALPGRFDGIRSFGTRVGEFVRRRDLPTPGVPLSPDSNGARALLEAPDHLRAALPQRRKASPQPVGQREDHGPDRGCQPAESHSEVGRVPHPPRLPSQPECRSRPKRHCRSRPPTSPRATFRARRERLRRCRLHSPRTRRARPVGRSETASRSTEVARQSTPRSETSVPEIPDRGSVAPRSHQKRSPEQRTRSPGCGRESPPPLPR